MSNTYYIDGDEYWVENLDADQAAAVLAGLHAENVRTSDPARKALLAAQIREVSEWIEFLAEEAAAEAAQEAAIEHAAALFADRLAGF
jgi:hypothetical protein